VELAELEDGDEIDIAASGLLREPGGEPHALAG